MIVRFPGRVTQARPAVLSSPDWWSCAPVLPKPRFSFLGRLGLVLSHSQKAPEVVFDVEKSPRTEEGVLAPDCKVVSPPRGPLPLGWKHRGV